jgi:hypothetical protein
VAHPAAVTPGVLCVARGTVSRMTSIDSAELDRIVLAKGGHGSPAEGLCLLEAVAYVRGIKHTDHPACVCPVLGAFGRHLNDVLPADLRQQLIPLIPDLPGTAGDGHGVERAYMALDWMIRTWLPAWLELSPACRGDAAKVRELGRVVDLASAERAGRVVLQARNTATGARSAARSATRSATRAAASDAAWDATGAAASDAAWDAAWDALQPTVTTLQESAIDLYSRMTRIGREVQT